MTRKRYSMSYQEARLIARGLKFAGVEDYREKAKADLLPPGLPKAPNIVYRGEFSWSDYLGQDLRQRCKEDYVDYEEAKRRVAPMRFRTQSEYHCYILKHGLIQGVPKHPYNYYSQSGQYKGWEDFAGIERFLQFEEACKVAAKMGISTSVQWMALEKDSLPEGMPSRPDNYYKNRNQWKGWPYFLTYYARDYQKTG